LYDGTIAEYPSSRPPANVFFHRQNISADADEGCSLSEWFSGKYNDIFLKMDIEGHEFAWLASLSTADLLKLKQIIIEIHLSDDSLQLQQQQQPVLSRLASTHALLHAHGNNCRNVPWLERHLCPKGDLQLRHKIFCRSLRYPLMLPFSEGIPNGPTYCTSIGSVHVRIPCPPPIVPAILRAKNMMQSACPLNALTAVCRRNRCRR